MGVHGYATIYFAQIKKAATLWSDIRIFGLMTKLKGFADLQSMKQSQDAFVLAIESLLPSGSAGDMKAEEWQVKARAIAAVLPHGDGSSLVLKSQHATNRGRGLPQLLDREARPNFEKVW